MIKDNHIVTLQRRENSLSLLNVEKRWLKVILIHVYVITNGMVRVNGELLSTVFHITTGMQHPVKLLCRQCKTNQSESFLKKYVTEVWN